MAVDDLSRINLVHLLVEAGFAASNGEARRLIRQGAVAIDDDRVGPDTVETAAAAGAVVRAGKRRFLRVVPR